MAKILQAEAKDDIDGPAPILIPNASPNLAPGSLRHLPAAGEGGRIRIMGDGGDESVVSNDAGGAVVWFSCMDNTRIDLAAPFKPRTWAAGVAWERALIKGGGPPIAVVSVLVRDPAFYRRHISASGSPVAKWTESREQLRTGEMDRFDITLLLWVLLNSGHDGQDTSMGEGGEGEDGPDDNGASFAHHQKCRGLVYDIPGVSTETVEALRAALTEVRGVRNQCHGHASSWGMGGEQFCKAIGVLTGAARAMDAVADELGWESERFEERTDR